MFSGARLSLWHADDQCAGFGPDGLVIGLFTSSKFNHPDARLFLATGILGGFTTFSTFSLDAVTLWERGEILAAFGYGIASVALSLAALMGVLMMVRRFA